jgi:solute carrier family 20 (sodium-dependent phosphate transporter)
MVSRLSCLISYRYHLLLGPLLWKRGPVPHCPEEQRIVVQNYYRGHLTKEELDVRDASLALYREATELGERMSQHISPKLSPVFPIAHPSTTSGSTTLFSPPTSPRSSPDKPSPSRSDSEATSRKLSDKPFVNFCKYTVWPMLKGCLLHGVDQDIVQLQKRDSRSSRARKLERMHSRAAHYDNQTEHLYSFLQVLTASTLSFAHGYLTWLSWLIQIK